MQQEPEFCLFDALAGLVARVFVGVARSTRQPQDVTGEAASLNILSP